MKGRWGAFEFTAKSRGENFVPLLSFTVTNFFLAAKASVVQSMAVKLAVSEMSSLLSCSVLFIYLIC